MNLTKYICQNRTKYFNKRTQRFEYSDCGSCPVCRYRKNMRQFSILTQSCKAYKHKFFVTLTYSRESIPTYRFYIKDFDGINTLMAAPVSQRIKDVDNSHYRIGEYNEELQGKLFSYNLAINTNDNFSNYEFPVLFYKDVQDFLKRLRIGFSRYIKGKSDIKFFCLSEYGAKYYRPHYHLLLFTNNPRFETYVTGTMREFKRYHSKKLGRDVVKYVSDLWKFGIIDLGRTKGENEAASYCSAYVSANTCDTSILSSFVSPVNFKKSTKLPVDVRNFVERNKAIILPMPEEDIKNFRFVDNGNIYLLAEKYNYACAIFPKCPYIIPRSAGELSAIISQFSTSVHGKQKLCDYIAEREQQPDKFRTYHALMSYLKRCYIAEHNAYCVEDIQQYMTNVIYSLRRFANYYKKYNSIEFCQKLMNLWSYFQKQQLFYYFNFLAHQREPFFSLIDGRDDIYKAQSLSMANDELGKAKRKKLHNDLNHKSK